MYAWFKNTVETMVLYRFDLETFDYLYIENSEIISDYNVFTINSDGQKMLAMEESYENNINTDHRIIYLNGLGQTSILPKNVTKEMIKSNGSIELIRYDEKLENFFMKLNYPDENTGLFWLRF